MRFISAIVSEPAFYFYYSLSRTHFPVLFIFYSRLIQTDIFFPALFFIYKLSFSRYDISIIYETKGWFPT